MPRIPVESERIKRGILIVLKIMQLKDDGLHALGLVGLAGHEVDRQMRLCAFTIVVTVVPIGLVGGCAGVDVLEDGHGLPARRQTTK